MLSQFMRGIQIELRWNGIDDEDMGEFLRKVLGNEMFQFENRKTF